MLKNVFFFLVDEETGASDALDSLAFLFLFLFLFVTERSDDLGGDFGGDLGAFAVVDSIILFLGSTILVPQRTACFAVLNASTASGTLFFKLR
jgi:hypothetical protein